MEYDKEIIRILTEAGSKGLSVLKVARHVYNACNSLFNELDFAEVHAYVTQYLLRNSKNRESLIERTERRGTYRLNPHSQEALQLMLQFAEGPQTTDTDVSAVPGDTSLPLFDDFEPIKT